MTSSDRDLIEELGNEPVDRKVHVRETEGSLHEMGEDLRRMGERLPHLEAQVDRAVDSRKGWPTGKALMDRAVDGAQREEIPLTYFIAQHCIGPKAANFFE